MRYEVGAVLNQPHEVDSKSLTLPPQLRPQLHKFSNWEIGNLKLRLKVTRVEAQVELLVGVKLGIFEMP